MCVSTYCVCENRGAVGPEIIIVTLCTPVRAPDWYGGLDYYWPGLFGPANNYLGAGLN